MLYIFELQTAQAFCLDRGAVLLIIELVYLSREVIEVGHALIVRDRKSVV